MGSGSICGGKRIDNVFSQDPSFYTEEGRMLVKGDEGTVVGAQELARHR